MRRIRKHTTSSFCTRAGTCTSHTMESPGSCCGDWVAPTDPSTPEREESEDDPMDVGVFGRGVTWSPLRRCTARGVTNEGSSMIKPVSTAPSRPRASDCLVMNCAMRTTSLLLRCWSCIPLNSTPKGVFSLCTPSAPSLCYHGTVRSCGHYSSRLRLIFSPTTRVSEATAVHSALPVLQVGSTLRS